VLVGGHAVAGHGEPRLTEDLDVFVEPTAANARRLREAPIVRGPRPTEDGPPPVLRCPAPSFSGRAARVNARHSREGVTGAQ
jgi:hypothetical protein